MHRFTDSFEIRRILPTLSLGLALGAITLPTVISFAVLIYSGDLASYGGAGIGLILFGGLIIQLTIAVSSSIPGIMGGPQDSPVAILALIGMALLAQMPSASPETKFITVTVAVMLTSILSGVFFLLVGGFKLGRFVRFIPYPVIGGFIAGTGFLLAQGAFGAMTGITPTFSKLDLLFTTENLLRWVPSLIFGIALVVGTRRFPHFLTIPVLLTATTALFYAIAFLSGSNVADLRAGGWLLGPFPQGSLWQPLDLSLISQIDWRLIANQGTNIAAVALISIVALLLNSNALELIAKKDLDLNRELIAAGAANIVGGLAGGSVGYHYLGFSAIPFRMNMSSRMIPMIAAAVTGFVLLFGASALSLTPMLLVGGVLFYLGITFLTEWVYDAWFQLPRMDYILVLLIIGVVATFGFLQGVGLGIAIAITLFVVNYSRIDIVKNALTGKTYQSNTERPFEHRQLIQRFGQQIEIMRLQGFVFFGTSQGLVQRVRNRINDAACDSLRYLILDFQHVTALDTSAVFSFVRLEQLAEAHKFHLILTDVDDATKTKLTRAGLKDGDEWIRYTVNMDYGMEWCESKLLLEEGGSTIIRAGTLRAQLKRMLPSAEAVEKFMSYLEKEEAGQYHIVINKGDAPDSMYFIDSGELSTRLQIAKGKFIRLWTQSSGTMIGEMGIFLKQPRTATVVANQDSILYRLSVENYNKMMRDDPELAFHLHQWIVRVLSVRLAENNHTLEALLS
jgi:SulP family sulfate permease